MTEKLLKTALNPNQSINVIEVLYCADNTVFIDYSGVSSLGLIYVHTTVKFCPKQTTLGKSIDLLNTLLY